MRRNRNSVGGPRWEQLPYRLDDRSFYMPYRRDHGLFRRVCHWSAAAMVGAPVNLGGTTGAALSYDDFPEDRLPHSVRPEWWHGRGERGGYWIRLDVSAAYPSSSLALLRQRLKRAVEHGSRQLPSLIVGGYPPRIVRRLEEASTRSQLVEQLMGLLDSINYETHALEDTWDLGKASSRPAAARAPGIPTGLAISGLLFNAYMRRIDRAMTQQMEGEASGKFAFLRFVDDMVLLGRDEKALQSGIMSLMRAAGHLPGARGPRDSLYLNLEKCHPKPIGEALRHFGASTAAPDSPNWELCRLSPGSVGPFLTHLVERLSDLGRERVLDRFGEGAANRLIALHELVRLQIQDAEIREDTRLAFAANRLAKASLPSEGEEREPDELTGLRESILLALDRAPHKHSLWRAVIRVSCRRTSAGLPKVKEARQFLKRALDRIRVGGSWAQRWPGDEPVQEDVTSVLSFLRAIFWKELAATLRSLQAGLVQGDGRLHQLSSADWRYRAVPGEESELTSVVAFISDIARWAKHLYSEGYDLRPWEARAIAEATVAATDGRSFLKLGTGSYDRVIDAPTNSIGVPVQLVPDPFVLGLLRQSDQLSFGALSFASAQSLLLLSNIKPRLFARWLVKRAPVSQALETLASRRWLAFWPTKLLQGASTPARNLWELLDRDRRRTVALGWTRRKLASSGLREILWSTWSAEAGWIFDPIQVPAVGLPVALAARVLLLAPGEPLSTSYGDWRELQQARVSQRLGAMVPLPPAWKVERARVEEHPAEQLLSLAGAKGEFGVRLWKTILTFFVALTGDESFCAGVLACWPAPVPLAERWRMRARIALPEEAWALVDEGLRACLESDEGSAREVLRALHQWATKSEAPNGKAIEAHRWELITVGVDGGANGERVVSASLQPAEIGDALRGNIADEGLLAKQLSVRIAQVATPNDWPGFFQMACLTPPGDFTRAVRQRTMRQIVEAVKSQPRDGDTRAEGTVFGPILLPEVTVPNAERNAHAIEHLARETGRAIFAGALWTEPPPCILIPAARVRSDRFLVNEAILAVPITLDGDSRSRMVRSFIVRKPHPTHAELGLATALTSAGAGGATWRMLRGTRWIRFGHREWGEFTVAICSDLLDSSPWRAMSGQLTHLFVLAHNDDVDLYDQLTWVRAYEGYVNLVAVNHGSIGGSFAWTPKHRHLRELARLRGGKLFVLADVALPVRDLQQQQTVGGELARARWAAKWSGDKNVRDGAWKDPPPSFTPRPQNARRRRRS